MENPYRFVFEIELPNQFPVISRINNVPANEELDLCVRAVSLYSIENAASHRTDGVVGVGPDVQIIHLPTLVWKPHNEGYVLPTKCSAKQKTSMKGKLQFIKILEFSTENQRPSIIA